MKISGIKASIIRDSRSEETIEVEVFSEKLSAKASVPSGKSKGRFEAVQVKAGEALDNIEKLKPKIIGRDFKDPLDFDRRLLDIDRTPDKANLGANTTLALGIAFLRLFSKLSREPLYSIIGKLAGVEARAFPRLFVNLINGGLHAGPEFGPLAFQEYLVIPEERSPKKALKIIFEFIEALKGAVAARQGRLIEGDEGGLVVFGDDPETGLKFFREAFLVMKPKEKINFGLDAATSSLFQKKVYKWRNKKWNAGELKSKYEKLIADYDLFSIEDPFHEEAWDDWAGFTKTNGQKIWVVGDDLTVTNSRRIKKAGEQNAVNAVIIKPNQIGTVLETIEAAKLARSFGWKIIVSHRSGETDDDFIADLAYGLDADGLKAGSPTQRERLVKYERLIRIEESLSLD